MYDPDDEDNDCNEWGDEPSDQESGRDYDYGEECESYNW